MKENKEYQEYVRHLDRIGEICKLNGLSYRTRRSTANETFTGQIFTEKGMCLWQETCPIKDEKKAVRLIYAKLENAYGDRPGDDLTGDY